MIDFQYIENIQTLWKHPLLIKELKTRLTKIRDDKYGTLLHQKTKMAVQVFPFFETLGFNINPTRQLLIKQNAYSELLTNILHSIKPNIDSKQGSKGKNECCIFLAWMSHYHDKEAENFVDYFNKSVQNFKEPLNKKIILPSIENKAYDESSPEDLINLDLINNNFPLGVVNNQEDFRFSEEYFRSIKDKRILDRRPCSDALNSSLFFSFLGFSNLENMFSTYWEKQFNFKKWSICIDGFRLGKCHTAARDSLDKMSFDSTWAIYCAELACIGYWITKLRPASFISPEYATLYLKNNPLKFYDFLPKPQNRDKVISAWFEKFYTSDLEVNLNAILATNFIVDIMLHHQNNLINGETSSIAQMFKIDEVKQTKVKSNHIFFHVYGVLTDGKCGPTYLSGFLNSKFEIKLVDALDICLD